MKGVLLDTGCIVALLDRSEQYHEICKDVISSIRLPFLTCEAVITESCYLLRHMLGAASAVLQNVQAGVFQIGFSLLEQSTRIEFLMKKYASVPIGFADACLISMAEEFNVGQIMTLDTDFEIYRFGKNKVFTNLVSLKRN